MENKHTIYFNMCHHYRKIFNAKSMIDTSPPKAFQISTNNQWAFSRNTSPFRPKTPVQKSVKTFQKEPFFMQDNGVIQCKYYYQHHNKKETCDSMNKSFIASTKPFNPVILKSNAQSKLRSLRVYHPPRKKKLSKANDVSQSTPNNGDDHKEDSIQRSLFDKPSMKSSKRQSFAVMDHNSYSEESSEDSAYNEGEGVLSSDSRGSTPQNLSNKHQSAKIILPESQQTSKVITNPTKTSEEIVYIQFLKDITNDILKKNIFTNTALKHVFQHHVQINKYDLNPEKMLKEISKLQERLGVPKDDKLDDEDYGLGKDISTSENITPTEDTSIKESKLPTNSTSIDQISENVSQKNEQISNEADSKEHDYSEDFSDYENHSIDSQSNADEIITSENNDGLSSVSDGEAEETENNDNESVAEENISEDDIESRSENGLETDSDEVSEIC